MIKKTGKKPINCECKLVYEWDDSTVEEKRIHTPLLNECTFCAIHGKLPPDEAYNQAEADNDATGAMFAEILANSLTLHDEFTQADGTTVRWWKEGMRPSFVFDTDRKLTISLPKSISPTETSALEIVITAKNGKVSNS